MSQLFIVDEWIVSDLRGENEREKQQQTLLFLECIVKICDQIVLLRGSPLMHKIYKLMKESNIMIRRISKFLQFSIIQNPNKCLLLEEKNTQPLPEDLDKIIPQDDYYLLQIHFTKPNSIIITTDTKLEKILSQTQNKNIHIQLRDTFLETYLKKCNKNETNQ